MSKMVTTFKTATSMDEEANGDDCLLPHELGDRNRRDTIMTMTNDSSPLTKVERVTELSFCLALMVSGIALEGASLTPRMRPIPYQLLESGDYVINQIFNANFDGETVPSLHLIIFAVLIPVVAQVGLGYFYGKNHVHKTFCVYLSGLGLNSLVTNCAKLYIGYLRPIFYEFCDPDDSYEECTSGTDREVRLSFPSGHSSIAFCGLCLLSFYLELRFGVSKSRAFVYNRVNGHLMLGYDEPIRFKRIVSLLCYFPVLVACFIAASRVADNKHHPADVVGGALLGGSIAVLVQGIWFPSWPTTVEGFVS